MWETPHWVRWMICPDVCFSLISSTTSCCLLGACRLGQGRQCILLPSIIPPFALSPVWKIPASICLIGFLAIRYILFIGSPSLVKILFSGSRELSTSLVKHGVPIYGTVRAHEPHLEEHSPYFLLFLFRFLQTQIRPRSLIPILIAFLSQ